MKRWLSQIPGGRWHVGPVFLLFLFVLLGGCRGAGGSYEETFDNPGNWVIETSPEAETAIVDGRYHFLLKSDNRLHWSTAGLTFGDGIYEVEATQLDGPLDNGYGMIFRVQDDNQTFYALEVSGDGYVRISRFCSEEKCDDPEQGVMAEGWFPSEAVNAGLNAMNRLRVRAEAGNMIFFVNEQEVGRVTDNELRRGDIGVIVEPLGEGGILIAFDNFRVLPLQ